MNRHKLTLILTLGCLTMLVINVTAQQPATGKSGSPRLTSDDVVRGRTTATVVLNPIDAKKWTKHNPAGLRLSLDLPDGIYPREADVPTYALNAPHAEYDATLYVGKSSNLQVNLLHIPGKKLYVGQSELRKAAAAFVKAFATKTDPKAVYTTHMTNGSTVALKATMTGVGGPFEMIGSMQSKGMEMWLVVSIFRQSDEPARAAARRITSSATMN